MLPREMLYIADEAFFVGTAVEITPIRSVDKIAIGNGDAARSPRRCSSAFFDVINGEVPDRHDWLTYVYPGEPLEPAGATAAAQTRALRTAARRWPGSAGQPTRPCTSTIC